MPGRPKRHPSRRNPAAGQWKKKTTYRDYVARRAAQLEEKERKRNFYHFHLKKAEEAGDVEGVKRATKLLADLDKPSPNTPAVRAKLRAWQERRAMTNEEGP